MTNTVVHGVCPSWCTEDLRDERDPGQVQHTAAVVGDGWTVEWSRWDNSSRTVDPVVVRVTVTEDDFIAPGRAVEVCAGLLAALAGTGDRLGRDTAEEVES